MKHTTNKDKKSPSNSAALLNQKEGKAFIMFKMQNPLSNYLKLQCNTAMLFVSTYQNKSDVDDPVTAISPTGSV